MNSTANLTFRPATMLDSLLIIEWRTHPGAVECSLTGRQPTHEENQEYITKALHDPGAVLMIAELDQTPIGMILCAETGEGEAELDVVMAPEMLGLLWRQQVIRRATQAALSQPQWQRIVHRIRPTDHDSRKTYRRAGFAESSQTETEVTLFVRR